MVPRGQLKRGGAAALRRVGRGHAIDPRAAARELADPVVERIVVAVIEEQEIVRRGLIAALEDDDRLRVDQLLPGDLVGKGVVVAVVSSLAASRTAFPCPILLCTDGADADSAPVADSHVVGVLQRRSLTAAQLRASVHAAAAGLQVQADGANGTTAPLDQRAREVLKLLAEGLSTREIAERMNYSERTIKKLIATLEHHFGARSRAQIVASAIRSGLI